ncbi:hypothetical protein SAMN02927924_01406 [Sphingobium faniae]|nr:hypothetical protein SAMN02927924_01406 [Sphingobium faniae]
MSDGFSAWAEPATKGDVIKLGIRFMGVANALSAIQARILNGEDQAAYAELNRYFDAMKALSSAIDEIGGKEE